MLRTKIYAIVAARLVMAGILIVIRWIFQLPFFVLFLCYTLCELIINGATDGVAELKRMNDEELINKAK